MPMTTPAVHAWSDFLRLLSTHDGEVPLSYQVLLNETETRPVPLSANPNGSDMQIMAVEGRVILECTGAPRILDSGIVLLPSVDRRADVPLCLTTAIHISSISSVRMLTDLANRMLPDLRRPK